MIGKYIARGLFALGAVATVAGCSKHIGSELKLDELIGGTPKSYSADTLNQCGRQFYVEGLNFYEIGREDLPAKAKFDAEGNIIGISSEVKYIPKTLEGITELKIIDEKSNVWGKKGLENSIGSFTEEDVKHKVFKNKLVIGDYETMDEKEYGVFCSENPQERDKYGEPVRGGYDIYIFEKDSFLGYTISEGGEIVINVRNVSKLVPSGRNELKSGTRVEIKNKKSDKKSKSKKKEQKRPFTEKSFFPHVNCGRVIIAYPVQEGDTLEGVAKKLDLIPDYMKRNLKAGKIGKERDTLYRGDVLEICGISCWK